MNIEYLTKEIIPVRNKEIEEGKSYGTRNPIYTVMDVVTHVVEGHSEYLHMQTLNQMLPEWGYVDMSLDSECRNLEESKEGMSKPKRFTRFFTDRFVAFFLTSEAAHDYLNYQSHNLSKHAYVYVHYAGYSNKQMDKLFKTT